VIEAISSELSGQAGGKGAPHRRAGDGQKGRDRDSGFTTKEEEGIAYWGLARGNLTKGGVEGDIDFVWRVCESKQRG